MSRPRRFGKSLLVDTMRAFFAGEKELFKGLYIEKKLHEKYSRDVVILIDEYDKPLLDNLEKLAVEEIRE